MRPSLMRSPLHSPLRSVRTSARNRSSVAFALRMSVIVSVSLLGSDALAERPAISDRHDAVFGRETLHALADERVRGHDHDDDARSGLFGLDFLGSTQECRTSDVIRRALNVDAVLELACHRDEFGLDPCENALR